MLNDILVKHGVIQAYNEENHMVPYDFFSGLFLSFHLSSSLLGLMCVPSGGGKNLICGLREQRLLCIWLEKNWFRLYINLVLVFDCVAIGQERT